ACLQKPAGIIEIDRSGLARTVGAVRAADVWRFVPLQSEPAERAQDCLVRLRRRPRSIGVLNPQHELPLMLAGENVVEQRLVGSSYMRIARGRGCDTNADLRHGLCKDITETPSR